LCALKFRPPKEDVGLIRALAETLRGGAEKARALRSTLAKAVMDPQMSVKFFLVRRAFGLRRAKSTCPTG
jgi:hypothetical protein